MPRKILEDSKAAPCRKSYSTELGTAYESTIESFLASQAAVRLKGRIQLIFTSPPFPLTKAKAYGNRNGPEYLEWLSGLTPRLVDLLTPDGSLVVEIGNAWESRRPVMSTLPLRSLLAMLDGGNLQLCQQFICHNPARLPSPVEWVNVKRIRVKDSYTNVWWMSPSDRPKADNRKVLVPYSDSMKALLRTGKYNAGKRPSGHTIGERSFAKDNGGAIPPSVLEISNTSSKDVYRKYCAENGLTAHPAPMQGKLAEFFIKLLTDEGDIVFDPFGGSNLTGGSAEALGRRWITTEPSGEYLAGSKGRFARSSLIR
jgi:DNA methylase